MINVEINGKLVGQCESAGKASSPLFKDVIDPWIEIRGFTASSPSLTDDQQVVLEWLKGYALDDSDFKNAICELSKLYIAGVPYKKEEIAFKKLNDRELAQVLAAFTEWGLSNA